MQATDLKKGTLEAKYLFLLAKNLLTDKSIIFNFTFFE